MAAPNALLALGNNVVVKSALLERAKAALAKHSEAVKFHDVIGIADYGAHSAKSRFHIVNLVTGQSQNFLVSHGKGSDEAHTGWLKEFSNLPGSEATSSGAYLTAETYTGKHGHSQRLDGLDPQNDQARPRAIVMHGAWYVNSDLVRKAGKIGRSQGCFAFAESNLQNIFDVLKPGHLIYAGR